MKTIRRWTILLSLILLAVLDGCGTEKVKKPEVVDLEGSPIPSLTGMEGNGQGTNLDSVNRQLSFQEAAEYADLVLGLSFNPARELFEEYSAESHPSEDTGFWPDDASCRVNTTENGVEHILYYNEYKRPVLDETAGRLYTYFEDGSLAFYVEDGQPTFFSCIEMSDKSILLDASLTSEGRLSFIVKVNDAKGFRMKEVYCEDVNYEQFCKVFGEKDADSYVSAGLCVYETEYLWTENADESSTVSVQERDGKTYRRSYDSEGRLIEQVVFSNENGETKQDIERYDEYGNLVAEEHFTGERLEESIQYSNHYDSQGILAQVEVFEDENLQDTLTYRYEYDEHRRVTSFVISNEAGDVLFEEKTTYATR